MSNREKRKELVFVFVRNPELGKVKTRLAVSIGNEKALAVYKFLLKHTHQISHAIPFDKAIYYSEHKRENDIWSEGNYQKHIQQGVDLGERMNNAFIDSFTDGYDKVVIIGSDIPDLTEKHILEAFQKLDENDVVLGPAKDGGYYLLGMKKVHSKIFENKNWGTDSVRAKTMKDLEKVTVHLLEELNDIDVYEDIKNHPNFKQFLN